MALVNILHMNIGNGDSSYASNSFPQEDAARKALPFLKHTLKGMANHDVFFNRCFMIADLGCGSSKNTLSVASNIINAVHELCQENHSKTPQFQVLLNDLFGNDFNTLFKLLPNFYEDLYKDKGEGFGPCFVSVVPGSFYGRLYPDESLHFVHSSYSVHWLSQVPQGLENNKLNIYLAKRSPVEVLQAYGKQFHTDFTNFLQLRSKELVRGGRMFLTLAGRPFVDLAINDCFILWELLATSLLDMLKEGLVQECDLNSFNLPCYTPCEDELKEVIQYEGSFCLDDMNLFEANWDQHDTDYRNTNDDNEHMHGKHMVKGIRAITEPLLASHFGSSIIDLLFSKYEKHVAEQVAMKKAKEFFIAFSLTKK